MSEKVSYTAMEHGTQEDCDIVNAHFGLEEANTIFGKLIRGNGPVADANFDVFWKKRYGIIGLPRQGSGSGVVGDNPERNKK